MFAAGDVVCWRSIHGGDVYTARPMIVVRDDAELIGLYLPVGATFKRRSGQRGGGPRGRQMLAWDGGHEDRTWTTYRTLILYRPGRAHTVQLFWGEGDLPRSWYINPEAPWRRTAIGFDTADHVLDIVIAPDRSTWELKDADELAWAVEQGEYTPAEAAAIEAEAERARDEVLAGRPPWTDDWLSWRPDARWPIPALPPDWRDAPTT